MKIETWNGYDIRFVEKDGEWWAVLKDITDALGLTPKGVAQRLKDEVISNYLIKDSLGRNQKTLIVSEFGIYDVVFASKKKAAIEFRHWVYGMLKELRRNSGLEGFQIFRMMDKEHQKKMMSSLCQGLREPKRVDFIKANQIANKAVSNLYGLPRMVKKEKMTPEMLVDREPLLEETVELMKMKEKYGMDFSVSETIYKTLSSKEVSA